MILLFGLVFILTGEPSQCLEADRSFKFNGDIRHFAVATNSVYIATEEKLYHLNHELSPLNSQTQRGILIRSERVEDDRFHRVSGTNAWNATFSVNVLLPFVKNNTLISCGVTNNGCGYCELLDLRNISKVLYSEHYEVGPPWHSSASVAFLVNVRLTRTETYILSAIQQHDKPRKTSCSSGSDAVKVHNSNNYQKGQIFSPSGERQVISIKREGNISVEFVDGFQVDSFIYLFSNLPSRDKRSKVRLLWLEGKTGKTETLKSLRGATLSIPGAVKDNKLLASSVVPGGPPVLWGGVFSVDGGQTDTQLVLFDISPKLTSKSDADPDFCTVKCGGTAKDMVGIVSLFTYQKSISHHSAWKRMKGRMSLRFKTKN